MCQHSQVNCKLVSDNGHGRQTICAEFGPVILYNFCMLYLVVLDVY